MKASDFIFCVDLANDPGFPSFCITSAEYFNESGCLNDGGDDEDVEKFLPNGFSNLMEACWEYNGTWEEGKQKLVDAGFVYNDALHEFINNYNPNAG